MDTKRYQMECAVADVIAIVSGVFVGKKIAAATDNKYIGVAAGVTTTAATGTIMNNAIAKKHDVKPFEHLNDETKEVAKNED